MAVYTNYNFGVGWDQAPNDDTTGTNPFAPGRTKIPTFMCPSDTLPDRVTDTRSRMPMDYMATCELMPTSRTAERGR